MAAAVAAILSSFGVVISRKLAGRISPISPEIEISQLAGVPTINLNLNGDSEGAVAAFYGVHLYDAPVVTVLQRAKTPTVEFASALAETATSFSRRVMVIDADAESPMLHQRFGHPQSPGLADVLVGRAPLRKVVRRASIDNPTAVLTAGSADNELQGPERAVGTQQIVAAAGADCAIVSTTSASTLHDALRVAHYFPSNVVLALNPREVTRLEIQSLTNSVRSVGGSVTGIVLHDGRSLGSQRQTWRQRRTARRKHMKRQVARDWSER